MTIKWLEDTNNSINLGGCCASSVVFGVSANCSPPTILAYLQSCQYLHMPAPARIPSNSQLPLIKVCYKTRTIYKTSTLQQKVELPKFQCTVLRESVGKLTKLSTFPSIWNNMTASPLVSSLSA